LTRIFTSRSFRLPGYFFADKAGRTGIKAYARLISKPQKHTKWHEEFKDLRAAKRGHGLHGFALILAKCPEKA
jgi:hypothetical protein